MGGMQMFMVPINYWAVLASAIAAMVIGSFWYSPFLFIKQWLKLSKTTEKDWKNSMKDKKKANTLYAVMFVGSLVMSYVMAHFVYYMHATTWLIGVKLALWVWLGFVAATGLPGYLFEGRPWKLFAINAGNTLVTLLVMGVILSVWH